MMDLIYHGLAPLAFRFINAYLEHTGDYAAMAVLRFYLVQRALIRAKVARIRALQAGIAAAQRDAAERSFRRHLLLARRLARRRRAALIVMHGLSGSGKSSIAQGLLEALGAVRLRSDVERKRLFGLEAVGRTGAVPDGGIYSAAAGARTYARLAEIAGSLLAAGYPVIVDAACLQRDQRELLCRVAMEHGLPFAVVSCEAALPVLRERVARREQQGADASDADLAILERQRRTSQPLGADEMAHVVRIATAVDGAGGQGIAIALAWRLGLVRYRNA
jgi:predicted kinase